MLFIVVICSLVVLLGVLLTLRRRGRVTDPVIRHARALAALRDLADHPSPCTHDATAVEQVSIEHVHILREVPPAVVAANSRRRRTKPAARKGATARRRNPQAVAALPTIAQLPTLTKAIAPPTLPAARHPRAARAAEPALDTTKPRREPRSTPPAATADGSPVARVTDGDRNALRVEPVGKSNVRERVLAIGAAVAVCVAIVAIAGFAETRPAHRTHLPAAPERHPAAPKPQPVVTAPRPAAPRPPAISLVAAASGDGTVAIGAPFTVAFVPSGDCWIRVRTASGQAVFEGTLHAGQRQQITGSGPLVVRVGNTLVLTMDVNGTPLDLSRVAHTANIQFVTG
jgi:endonuclease YncB( thermonuclease family)